MKQLTPIQARFLKRGDLIFDFQTRVVEEIDYVGKECSTGTTTLANIHISYGINSEKADNLLPNDEVLILIDIDSIPIQRVKP